MNNNNDINESDRSRSPDPSAHTGSATTSVDLHESHENEKRILGSKLETLKPVSFQNGKPVFIIPSTTVINFKSGFGHKLLCDSITFTTGSACVFKCTFCYVITMLRKNKFIITLLGETGLKFSDIVVRRANPVELLRKKLAPRGKEKFNDPSDTRVIYASPLVDVAATMELVHETVQMCKAILELTHWQIRLLSKSPLILKIAEEIPDHFQHRMIYGLSTGTLDPNMARVIEVGTGLVNKRLEVLHTLQDRGLRTYGMACPILPQANTAEYARRLVEAIRVDQCEHVWAEILNVRDRSFTATRDALRDGGYLDQAAKLEILHHDPKLREQYARATFLALSDVVSPRKLRFLQYVNKHTIDWWRAHEHQGAVLLGKASGR